MPTQQVPLPGGQQNNGSSSATIDIDSAKANDIELNNKNKTDSNGTNNNQSTKTTKLNGLKNRIIQRPPPLILDKVSNFYHNQTHSPVATTQKYSSHPNKHSDKQLASNYPAQQNNEINSSNQQQQQQQQVSQSGKSNSANHKFWASLNLNASRTRGNLVAPPTSDATNNTIETNNKLGADLIITHRNSISNGAANKIISKSSSSFMQKQSQLQHQLNKKSTDEERNNLLNDDDANLTNTANENDTSSNKNQDMSNNSELDDSSTHGGIASENDGGNLIGVDNPTPPASTVPSDSHRADLEPPASATSSRPRSNNPFLATDEELLSSLEAHNDIPNNFSKRPASFIAATDRALVNQRSNYNTANNLSETQQMVQDQFNNMHFNDQRLQLLQPSNQIDNNAFNSETIFVNQQQAPPLPNQDQRDSIYGKHSMMLHHHQLQQQQDTNPQQSIYGSYVNYEPTISVDSESAVCNPPPSATLQLPHWTDAIYELNNAILESSSVAGGAENGEFIYIIESGDIILEFDQIKVSGFTLVEFTGLLESKPVHLLSAVQTKHSHGLTVDLKHFLNCRFPKNSIDKELQDLIRENIYRRTIPCTTRMPKDGEVDKIDYHFLTKEQFVEMNNRGMLLECGVYGGHYYGTMKPFSDLNNLTIYGSLNRREMDDDMRQPLNSNHPAIGLSNRKENSNIVLHPGENPLYENHESLRLHQMQATNPHFNTDTGGLQYQHANIMDNHHDSNHIVPNIKQQSSIVAVDSEALPHGWERVIDQTHGTYYIDHNTQRTQYERPYEIELTKGSMGFGFTLFEAENGVLLVRSVIPGGPAHMNGTIRPGDILISAVGVSVAGLQHTDIARLFSTFAVGDRVRLTFAHSTYVVDANLVPDEYLFSNGTNGDLTVAVNSNYLNYFNQNITTPNPHILVNQDFEFVTVQLKRGDQGFGFTINDSVAGQKVGKIQNHETCANLKQGDILVSLNGLDITKLVHKEVVERLKKIPVGQDVTLIVKRKRRFRSKTPMAMHTGTDEFPIDNAPQRNCKTPNLDGLMLRRSNMTNANYETRSSFPDPNPSTSQTRIPSNLNINSRQHLDRPFDQQSLTENYYTIPSIGQADSQSIYSVNPMNNELYYNQQSHIPPPPTSQFNSIDSYQKSFRPPSISASEGAEHMTNSINQSETSLPPIKFANVNGLNQINQYNNFMNNDKLMMMQIQQQRYNQQMMQPSLTCIQTPEYHHMPLYSNSDMLKAEAVAAVSLPMKSVSQYTAEPLYNGNFQNNYYANNEELTSQQVQYGYLAMDHPNHSSFMQHQPIYTPHHHNVVQDQDNEEYERHIVELDREDTDTNWGIRLIGGSEVDRAISIGSIVFGGAASKNGKLKSGDEIISINGKNVVGATHQHVVELISSCSNRAELEIRRKKFGEACEVVLTRNMDEGFGFVIISRDDCTVIGKIIEGSPADRCKQLNVRDRIIAVNDRYITHNTHHPEIVNMIKECGSTLRLRIIPVNCYTVELIKSIQNDNFGFSMRGGSEYDGTPLYILRVAPDGLARDLLNVGDQIIEINNIPTVGMTHSQAATIIRYSDPIVKLKLRRNFVTPPSLLVDSPRALQRFNQVTAEMKTVNSSSTPPNYINGSCEFNSSDLPQSTSSLVADQQQQQTQQTGSKMAFGQTMPLYAT